MEYDAIIIGAGLGGCAAAASMAGAGKKVLVLERTDRIGGRCSSEEREGRPLDIASTTIARSEFGPYMEALRRVGKEDAVSFGHVKKAMLKLAGNEFRMNLEPMMKFMNDKVPARILEAAGSVIPTVTGNLAELVRDNADQTIEDYLSRYARSKVIHNIINTFTLYVYGTPYWMTSMGEFIQFTLDLMEPMMSAAADGEMCVGFLKGGLLTYPTALREGVEEREGEFRTGVGVKQILVEDGKVKGVVTEDGEKIEARIVLSNAGIKETVGQLVGKEHFTDDYNKYIDDLIPGISGTCLRIMVNKEVTDLDLILNIPPEDTIKYYHELWDEHKIPDGLPPMIITVPSTVDPTVAPKGHQLILGINAISFEPRENWPKWEEKLLGTMIDAIPEIEGHIVWRDYLNPGTYLVFGEEQSPAIGIAQCVGQVRDTRPSSKSPVEGLYYVGAEAGKNISGMASEMAIGSGLACADYILTQILVPA
ncbi:MAG: NAD(P)/FAD-dependent oxidoreductase [Actinobacteria bacterium]|nr:NAD(P)/FAD-dependent oxidoreductase [Actinomycetota bacterium]